MSLRGNSHGRQRKASPARLNGMPFSREQSLRFHERIRALVRRIADEKVRFRKPDRISKRLWAPQPGSRRSLAADRDRAFSFLVNKAANSHQAVRVLVEHGLAHDALAVARVLLENYVVIAWILKDPVFRLDLYCASSEVFKAQWAKVIREHYQHNPTMQRDAERWETNEARQQLSARLGKDHTKWARELTPDGGLRAVSVKRMFHDVGEVNPTTEKRTSFEYDGPYFEMSGAVHSTVMLALSSMFPESSEFFAAETLPDASVGDRALSIANISMVRVLSDFEKYTGVDFGPELQAVWNDMMACRGTSAGDLYQSSTRLSR